jgi:hypothetical protein
MPCDIPLMQPIDFFWGDLSLFYSSLRRIAPPATLFVARLVFTLLFVAQFQKILTSSWTTYFLSGHATVKLRYWRICIDQLARNV